MGDGYSRDDFHIVPFPINFPQLLRFYLPEDCIHFLTIFDEWGKKKEQQLKNFGLTVQVLTDKDVSEKSVSATEVRERILKDRNWKELVPPSTHRLIESFKLKDRIRKLKELSL